MKVVVGSGKNTISPALGTTLAGYAGEKRITQRIHDDLYARVITIEYAETTLVIISLDLLSVDRAYTQKLQQSLLEQYNIPRENIFVHATHTHSGPGGIMADTAVANKAFPYLNGWVSYDNEMVESQHQQIAKAVGSALSSAEECTIRYGEKIVPGVSSNRIAEENPHNPKLKLIAFQLASGRKILLYHFASHPTILHADNLAVSADFPGVTSANLEEKDEIQLALFLNGPSGDISTRFTRRESTFQEVQRMGTLLSDGILDTLNKMDPLDTTHLKAKWIEIELPVRTIKEDQTLEKELASFNQKYLAAKENKASTATLRAIESVMEGITVSRSIGDTIRGIKKVKTALHILTLGKIILVGIPGELFEETGNEIEQSFQNHFLLISGNTNDYLSYLLPSEYYGASNYEASTTLFEKGSLEKIKEEVINAIDEIIHHNQRKTTD